MTDSLNRVPVYGEKIVSRIRKTKNGLKQLFIPGMLFENMGLTYLGPVDGHNIGQVMRALEEAKRVEGAVILHVFTKKGNGYAPQSAILPDSTVQSLLISLPAFRRTSG